MVPRDEKVNCVEKEGKVWARGKQTVYSKQSTKETPGRDSSRNFGHFESNTVVSSYHMPKLCLNRLDAQGLKKNTAESLPDGSPEPHRGERDGQTRRFSVPSRLSWWGRSTGEGGGWGTSCCPSSIHYRSGFLQLCPLAFRC